MSQSGRNRSSDVDTPGREWKDLYKVSGVAACVAVFIFRRWLAEEFLFFRGLGLIHSGPRALPSSVLDWFTLLHTNPLIGLTLLNVFDMVNYVLVGLIFLGLYAALRQANKSYMTIAVALAFVGIAVYIASNPAFSMLSLSQQYAAATTDGQRSMCLAAGQAPLAISNTSTFSQATISFLFVTLAGLIVSTVMLRSRIFGKGTASMGILANVFGLSYPIGLAVAPQMVVVAVISLSASACFLVVWYLGIARRFFQLANRKAAEHV